MTDRPVDRLRGDEVAALRFAARRQLSRWAAQQKLSPDQRARRAALVRAVRTLERKAFAPGCELRVLGEDLDG